MILFGGHLSAVKRFLHFHLQLFELTCEPQFQMLLSGLIISFQLIKIGLLLALPLLQSGIFADALH